MIKPIKIIPFIVILMLGQLSYAQLSFNTGSIELDKNLGIINTNAKLDLKTFKLDFSVKSNLPIPKIDDLLQIMEPAEVVLANEIANITDQPIDNVVSSYKVNKNKGWGSIAKDMGIKPGSPEFHKLKNLGKDKQKSDQAKNQGKKNGKSKSHEKGKKK